MAWLESSESLGYCLPIHQLIHAPNTDFLFRLVAGTAVGHSTNEPKQMLFLMHSTADCAWGRHSCSRCWLRADTQKNRTAFSVSTEMPNTVFLSLSDGIFCFPNLQGKRPCLRFSLSSKVLQNRQCLCTHKKYLAVEAKRAITNACGKHRRCSIHLRGVLGLLL